MAFFGDLWCVDEQKRSLAGQNGRREKQNPN
jgi:hypothetical protein